MIHSPDLKRVIGTLGLETRPKLPTGEAAVGESFEAMDESLTEQRRVSEEGFRIRKTLLE
ncbi:hypothetical protein JL36_12790 [Lactococcus cremoris]|nr:hypothetical protein JL36_12790 [Lactococcus cremoris]